MAIYSCYGCVAPKRYPGCHAVCPEYLAQKEQHDKDKAEMFKKNQVEYGLDSQAIASITRGQKITKRMKGKKT